MYIVSPRRRGIIENWHQHCSTRRPRALLGYLTSAPVIVVPPSMAVKSANRLPSRRARDDEGIGDRVRASFLGSDRIYGAGRVWRDVLAEGIDCGLHRIERSMRAQALRSLTDRSRDRRQATSTFRETLGLRRKPLSNWPTYEGPVLGGAAPFIGRQAIGRDDGRHSSAAYAICTMRHARVASLMPR